MYNAYEPFVNLANANLALFHRFANSGDITRLLQNTVNSALMLPQESISKASQTNAYDALTRGLVDNFTRFTQEYVNSLTQVMSRSQDFLLQQVKQGSRQFAEITEAAAQTTDDIVDTSQRSAKAANKRRHRNTR